MHMKRFVIDGSLFADASSFFEHAGSVFCPDFDYGRNLDALNDILRGGFGAFDYGEQIQIEWRASDKSQHDLGFDETMRGLESGAANCDSSNKAYFHHQIEALKAGKGQTLFDVIVEIINENGHQLYLK